MSEFLRSASAKPAAPPAAPPGSGPPGLGEPAPPSRNNALTLLAAVGVLLLAMGVGVLIGRSASSSGRAPAPEVVTVGSSAGGTAPAAEETFTSDWATGKKGFTVELQTLPSSTTPAAVAAAKAADEAKGATAVGALKAEEFPSVGGEGFVIYSGVYSSKSEATKALGALKKKFPTAKVIEVSAGGASSSSHGSPSPGGGGGGVRSHSTAPPTEKTFKAPPKLSGGAGAAHGKKAVEESAKLPDVVETG